VRLEAGEGSSSCFCTGEFPDGGAPAGAGAGAEVADGPFPWWLLLPFQYSQGELCLHPLAFLFCVFLSAVVSGSIVAGMPLLVDLQDWLSERNPTLSKPRFMRVSVSSGDGSHIELQKMVREDAIRRGGHARDEAPLRYVRACLGKEEAALQRWQETLEWRAENDVDAMLQEPQPLFHVMKAYFPTYIHGKGRRGHTVVYERFGGVNVAAMAEQGVTLPML
jgi:hypothetical protein